MKLIKGGGKMTRLRYAFASVRYHKKSGYLLFLFYCLILTLSTFCLSLIQRQLNVIAAVKDRWNVFLQSFPSAKTSIFNQVQLWNKEVLKNYIFIGLFSILFFLIVFLLVNFKIQSQRKREIESLEFLGLKPYQMTLQFILELFLPLLYSFFTLITFALLFSNFFVSTINQSNDYILNQHDASMNKVALEVHSANQSQQAFLSFNQYSFLNVENHQTSLAELQLYLALIGSFLIISFSSILVSFISSFSYIHYLRKKI